MSYSKFIDTTATNFTLAAYRYSTKGYYSFSDALYSREGYQRLRAQYDDYEDRFWRCARHVAKHLGRHARSAAQEYLLRLTLISACSITGARCLSPAHSAITELTANHARIPDGLFQRHRPRQLYPCRPAGYGTGTVKKRRAFTSPSACRSRCLIIMRGSPPA